jgi:hypothetical protein
MNPEQQEPIEIDQNVVTNAYLNQLAEANHKLIINGAVQTYLQEKLGEARSTIALLRAELAELRPSDAEPQAAEDELPDGPTEGVLRESK